MPLSIIYVRKSNVTLYPPSPRVLATSLTPTVRAAQGVNLASDFTTWNRYGSATAANQTPGNGFTYSDLVLTSQGTGGQAGAGFAPAAISLDYNQAFTFDFHFFIAAVQSTDLRGDAFAVRRRVG